MENINLEELQESLITDPTHESRLNDAWLNPNTSYIDQRVNTIGLADLDVNITGSGSAFIELTSGVNSTVDLLTKDAVTLFPNEDYLWDTKPSITVDAKSISLRANQNLMFDPTHESRLNDAWLNPNTSYIDQRVNTIGLADLDVNITGSGSAFIELTSGVNSTVDLLTKDAVTLFPNEDYLWDTKPSITVDAKSISLRANQNLMFDPTHESRLNDAWLNPNTSYIDQRVNTIGLADLDVNITGSGSAFIELTSGVNSTVDLLTKDAVTLFPNEDYLWDTKPSITVDAKSISLRANQNLMFDPTHESRLNDACLNPNTSYVGTDELIVKDYEDLSLESHLFDQNLALNRAKELFNGLLKNAGSDFEYSLKKASISNKKINMTFIQFNFSSGRDIIFNGDEVHIGDKIYVLKE